MVNGIQPAQTNSLSYEEKPGTAYCISVVKTVALTLYASSVIKICSRPRIVSDYVRALIPQ